MASDGSRVSNTPAAGYNSAPSQSERQIHQDRRQRPPSSGFSGSGYTSNDNYLVQHARDLTSTPNVGPVDPHLHSSPVAGPAHPVNPAFRGFPPGGIQQQLTQRFTTNHGLVGLQHQYGTYYNSDAYNQQGYRSARTTPSGFTVFSSTAERGRLHQCPLCPSRFTTRGLRGLQRHYNSCHRSPTTPMYICGCGRPGSQVPLGCKSNHIRHVESCNGEPCLERYYACACGVWTRERDVHLSHVRGCSLG